MWSTINQRSKPGLARFALLLAACAANPPQGSQVEYYPVPGARTLPFAEAVRVGEMLYLSGQLGTDSTGQLVPGGIGPETSQALRNVATVLARHGATLADVIKCTAMLADMGEWAAMNEVYVRFFQAHLPARSAFGTTGLALGARLELECVAVLGHSSSPSLSPAPSCAVGDTALVRDVLYFGRNRPEGGAITDKEWRTFLDEVLTPRFPAGLTVVAAMGQWTGQTGRVEQERSQVVTLFHSGDEAARRAVVEVTAEYKRRFQQEAVLRERMPSCARFE
jgi:2-iminobutanoate/2-iminopropanoate deaminase